MKKICKQVQMKKIKVDMFCIVLLLFFRTVVSSSYATDCSPSIKNITCICSNISLSCHGIQENILDIVKLVANTSDSFPFEKNFSVDITIENIFLEPNSSFTNMTIGSLKLSSGLSDIPDALFSGIEDSLHILNLSSNSFDEVPSGSLRTLKQLHTLDLSHNNISTLSKSDFEGLENLRTMNLEYNIISAIEPDAFLNLSSLQMLNLGHNALEFLNSSAFKGLLNLNQLSISGNRFDSLKSESIVMLPSLKTLYADNNSLVDLENIQVDSINLQELSIRRSAIQGPLKTDSLRSLPGLTSADFSYNNITDVQSLTLSASYQLKHLNLSYNTIRSLQKNAFSALFNLVTLDLQHNEIMVVPESAFYNLTSLKYLNLNNNNLQAFLCPYTVDLISLESIHLENNQIKVINSGAFIYSQNLRELKLAGNELNCSCFMYDFSTYLLNRTSYWMEDVSVINCSSPQSEQGKSLINVDYGAMKCRSVSPCESKTFQDVFDDDDDEEEDDEVSTMPVLNGTNFTVSESFENFTTVDALNISSSISDNGTLFTAVLTSSTDRTDVVPENITNLSPNNTTVLANDSTTSEPTSSTDRTDVVPENFASLSPNNTTVLANDSTTSEPTINPFPSTTVYNDSINIKNISFMGGKLCVEWSVRQRILGDVRRCLLKYAQGVGKPMIRKYIKCPSRGSEAREDCSNVKAAVMTEFCIQLMNSSNKVFEEQCVRDNETLFSVPQTPSADHSAVVNTTSSIIVGSSSIKTSESTTPTPLGVTNVTDIFSNFTVSDHFPNETSLLTQTSSPELTSGIANLTSEFTQFSSSSSGLASTTKALSVPGVNETSTLKEGDLNTTSAELSSPSTTESILYKHSTLSSGTTASLESNSSKSTSNTEIIPSSHSISTPDPLNFSSLPPNMTVVQSNDSTASEHTVSPLSSTTVHDHPIDIKNFSLIDKKLCVEWSVNQQVLGDMLLCLLSYALGNKERITCPSLSNRISEECLFINAAVISELCIQIMNRSNKVLAKHCVHEHYIDHPPVASSSSPVSQEQIAFNITHLSVLREDDLVIVKWAVNREEPFSCSLKLNIESNSSVPKERDFDCTSSSYSMNSTDDNAVYEICLSSYHSDYDTVTVCTDYHMTKATADAVAAVKSAHYYTYAVLIGLLVLVICFISLLLVRAVVQKKSASDAYNVFRAEKSVSIRKQSQHQTGNENTSRYSYTAGEAV